MLADILRSTGTPDFVKTAVADDGTADFSTREATFITFARGLVKAASGDEQEHVDIHTRFWGIEKECNEFRAKLAALQQPWLLPDSAFCLLRKEASVRKYAAFDSASTRMAAISFTEQASNYPFAWRNEAATAILHKAAEYKTALPEYVENYLHKAACFGAADVEAVEEAILLREQITAPEHAESFQKVATVLEQMIADPALRTDMGFLKEAMAAVDAFDQASNPTALLIENIISDGLTLPSLQKMAAEDSLIVTLTNGVEVDCSKLTKQALAAVDPNLANMELGELASVLPTLPRPDAELLSRILS